MGGEKVRARALVRICDHVGKELWRSWVLQSLHGTWLVFWFWFWFWLWFCAFFSLHFTSFDEFSLSAVCRFFAYSSLSHLGSLCKMGVRQQGAREMRFHSMIG